MVAKLCLSCFIPSTEATSPGRGPSSIHFKQRSGLCADTLMTFRIASSSRICDNSPSFSFSLACSSCTSCCTPWSCRLLSSLISCHRCNSAACSVSFRATASAGLEAFVASRSISMELSAFSPLARSRCSKASRSSGLALASSSSLVWGFVSSPDTTLAAVETHTGLSKVIGTASTGNGTGSTGSPAGKARSVARLRQAELSAEGLGGLPMS
mmetsp:Transcript_31850/g.68620  ORF Transcript_31850/g.68620 Transcript_31850/m.68620 type:complete len:212 (-) Transcript_31850:437-1072(-)